MNIQTSFFNNFCKQRFLRKFSIGFLFLFPSALIGAESLPDFADLVKKNGPAVVNISSVQRPKAMNSYGRGNEEVPDILRYFFGDGIQIQPQEKKSLGSGFIISKDGYVLTNNHVVQDADEVIVRLHDRRELVADVVGSDSKSDLALLKIDADKLPVVKMGKSAELQVGEWVLAIGSPFGFEASATKGIVSHLGRSLPSENYVPFIQTDVPINPGNSGGPLFNMDGEVVGINSQIYSRTGGFMGLSFAIPIDTAMNVVEQIKKHGKVQRGWLGVVIQEVNKDLADSFGLEKPEGALVAQVIEKSPAANAGIKEGDVILEFNGENVATSSDLPIFVGATTVDSLIDVKVLRQKKMRTLKARIGALPEEEGSVPHKQLDKPMADKLGLIVSDLDRDQVQRWQVNVGVLVRQVIGNPALEAGIQAGDIITQLNNREVDGRESYQEVLQSIPDDKWIPVLVYRRGKPVYIPLYIPAKE
jgi:serine protease Do